MTSQTYLSCHWPDDYAYRGLFAHGCRVGRVVCQVTPVLVCVAFKLSLYLIMNKKKGSLPEFLRVVIDIVCVWDNTYGVLKSFENMDFHFSVT